MQSKIHCPFHQEETPSCHLYPDGFKCYGCGAAGRLADLPNVGHSQLYVKPAPKYVEDIDAKIKYIDSLSTALIRGHNLPVDGESYYIVWPSRDYYIQRFFEAKDDRGKYKCPSGHQRPLYVPRTGLYRGQLRIVEGELNALSVAMACEGGVVSPGSAGDFHSAKSDKHLPFYLQYDRIMLIADADKPGAIGCIELKSKLMRAGKTDVSIKLMSTDANDILVKHGQEALKKEVEMS
jgi:hypothetical protein